MFTAGKDLKDYLVTPPTYSNRGKVKWLTFYFLNGYTAPMDFSYTQRWTTKFQIISNDDKYI